MNRELEYKFFREFQHDGAAMLALKMANYKYCGIGNDVPARADYPDGVLDEIKKRTEVLDVWPWHGVENRCPLFDEITDNLDSCIYDASRWNYVISILKQFQTWIFEYSIRPKKLDSISNSVTLYSLEYYFHDWRNAFKTFAEKLAVVLAMRGINIIEIQQQCGISIIDNLNVDDLWMFFGTRILAEECLSKLNDSKRPNVETTIYNKTYLKVLHVLRVAGQSFEKKPQNYIGKDEEGIRDAFLSVLETHLKDCTVTGETFNKKGKTDLLVKHNDGTNIFIGECKIWKGAKYLTAAIDQLFNRYLTWRDTNTALMLFVRQDNITEITKTIDATCKAHPYYVRHNDQSTDLFSYIFHLPGDKVKEIFLEVLVFHFNEK